MKISLNWLKDYVALDASAAEITRAITFLGFEVEQVIAAGAPVLADVVVGEVLTRDKHPNADKLSVCTVDVGPAGGVKTIVCGAQNYKPGDRVPVALPGAVLPGNFVIKQSKIRGQLSDGMMCSASELGLTAIVGEMKLEESLQGGPATVPVYAKSEGLLILPGRPELGTPINAVLPAGDTVFDIEITPNRPDCLSHLGIARELAAWFKKDLIYPEEKFRGAPGTASRPDLLSGVRVDASEDCPLYTAHVITGVRIAPSPAWMQERLTAVGLRPINNIVDVGNYVMLEYGQPLHAFDARKLAGAQIVVRRAGDGEKITTLDGKERTLSSRMLVIADAASPVVVAGIMGGSNSGVDPTTTDLVLECAIFRPQSVRRTSKSLGLASDSSYRYERGVDAHLAIEAAWRAIDLILETAGGAVAGPICRVGGEVPWQREISVAPAFVRERLGFDIPDAEMRAALESLELNIVREEPAPGGAGGVAWTVEIPSWRDDLDRPIDLVEEVLRIYGTERIPAAPVTMSGLVGEDDPAVLFTRRATNYLVGHDFHECASLTLRPAAEVGIWTSQTAAAELALANPFVSDQSHLRPSLIMGLLESLRLNRSRGVPAARLCEAGRTFVESNGQNFECASAAFIMTDDPRRLWRRRDPADFYSAKHHVAALAAAAGVDLERETLASVSGPSYGWQEGHSASAGGIAEGWFARFGLLSLAMARALGIEGRIFAGTFSVLPEKLAATAASARRPRYVEPPAFPAALRDLALVVDAPARAGEVRHALAGIARAAAEPAFALESVEIFDVYEGQGLPEGKKSLAFTLAFRSAGRTLTDEEVNGAFGRIQEAIAAKTPYQIRT